MAKGSAWIFFQFFFLFFPFCFKVCITSIFSWKDEAFHFWIVTNAQILWMNGSQQERGNWEGE